MVRKSKKHAGIGFHVDIFNDVYEAIISENGRKWTMANVVMAAMQIKDDGALEIEGNGSEKNMKTLIALLVHRMSKDRARNKSARLLVVEKIMADISNEICVIEDLHHIEITPE